MRKISTATKIQKTTGKILTLLENSELSDEEIESVMRSTETALGMNLTQNILMPVVETPKQGTGEVTWQN